MKYSTATLCLFSAALTLAAPAPQKEPTGPSNQTTTTTIPSQSPGNKSPSIPGSGIPLGFTASAAQKAAGFLVPTMLKAHDISSNKNTQIFATSTQRTPKGETSTLYELHIPQELAGRTCAAVFHAGMGASVQGEKALDIFSAPSLGPLALSASGNMRDRPLGRARLDERTGFFEFDERDGPAFAREFPCPAGVILHGEAVAVGEFDVVVIQQDSGVDGKSVPNGLSFAYW